VPLPASGVDAATPPGCRLILRQGTPIPLRGCFGLALLVAALSLGACGEGEPASKPPQTTTAVSGQSAQHGSSVAAAADRIATHWLASDGRWIELRSGARVPIFERPGGKRVAVAGPRTEFGSPMSLSVLGDRDRGRWLEVTTSLGPPDRPLWVRSDPAAMRYRSTPYEIQVSLGERRLELRRDGEPAGSFPVTIGGEATSTPIGRFAITDIIVRDLDHAIYGCCALALSAHQSSLPPGWIGGDRVAIHGTDGPLGVAASTGCIRMRNDDLADLTRTVGLGTPVVIRP
jgi:hypothetical protein